MAKEKIKIKELEIKIGTRMYAVHKKYADEKINGGRIIVCRVKTFQNKQGKIMPVLIEVGNAKREINLTTHYYYYHLHTALEDIAGEGVKK